MTTLTLAIPDELMESLQNHRDGMPLEEYVLHALQVHALQAQPLDDETHHRLLEAIDSPGEPMDDQFWAALRARVEGHLK